MRLSSPILMIAAHTDDVELGCGGTLARLQDEGAEVHVAAFSLCDESLPPGYPAGTLGEEMKASMRSYGLPERQLRLFDYPVRRFAEYRQELLDDLIALRRELQPQTVCLPSG